MRRLILIISLLLFSMYSQGEWTYGEVVQGKMICKVKSHYIVEINEGKPKVYSKISNSFGIGDNLVFNFGIDKMRVAYIELLYEGKSLQFISSSGLMEGDITELIGDDGFMQKISIFDIVFTGDYINFDLGVLEDVEEFRIRRYYKSDWDGIIKGPFGHMGEQVATLDCRQSSDRVDDFIREVRKFAK